MDEKSETPDSQPSAPPENVPEDPFWARAHRNSNLTRNLIWFLLGIVFYLAVKSSGFLSHFGVLQ